MSDTIRGAEREPEPASWARACGTHFGSLTLSSTMGLLHAEQTTAGSGAATNFPSCAASRLLASALAAHLWLRASRHGSADGAPSWTSIGAHLTVFPQSGHSASSQRAARAPPWGSAAACLSAPLQIKVFGGFCLHPSPPVVLSPRSQRGMAWAVWAFVGVGCCVNCAALWYMFRVTRTPPRPTARVGEEIAIPLLFPEPPLFLDS